MNTKINAQLKKHTTSDSNLFRNELSDQHIATKSLQKTRITSSMPNIMAKLTNYDQIQKSTKSSYIKILK